MIIKNKIQIILTLIFLFFIAWWISFQSVLDKQGTSINWFENTYGLVALFGAVVGFIASKKWGGHKSILGKSLFFFALGLFAQEAGQLISSYYTQVAKVGLPYPSWGDLGYFGSVILYIIAAFYLAKSMGVKFNLKKSGYKAIAILLPVVLLAVTYRVLLHNHQYDTSKPLTVFLDIGYPMGEALYLSIGIVAYLLSRKLLGGVLKPVILVVIFALLVTYIADFTFIYMINKSSYVPGNYDDLFYLISYFVLSSALISFVEINNRLRSRKTE